jgi:hypothetical protein
MPDKVTSVPVNDFLFSDTKEEMRDSMDFPPLSSIPVLDEDGFWPVAGIIPRAVTFAQIGTDVPAEGEFVVLSDSDNCSVTGDGINPIKDLKINGTFEVEVDNAFITAHPELVISNALRLPYKAQHLIVYITDDISGGDILSVTFHQDNDLCTFILTEDQDSGFTVFCGTGSGYTYNSSGIETPAAGIVQYDQSFVTFSKGSDENRGLVAYKNVLFSA